MDISRRTLLSAGCAMLLPPSLYAANSQDAELLEALVKLRGTLDDRLVCWWMKGMRYGVVNERIDPIYGMNTGGFQLYRKIADDRYEMRMLELGYFSNPVTGEPLRQFANPYSGKTVDIPDQKLGPYTVYLTTKGVEIPRDPAFGEFELRTQLGPAVVDDDDIWFREDGFINVDSDHPMMGKHTYNEFVTYHGSMSDVQNKALATVPATVTYQSVTSWRKWMGSEGVDGHTTARAAGRKVFAVEDMPEDYLRVVREWYPEIMSDVMAALKSEPDR